jgi:hypothetical protein
MSCCLSQQSAVFPFLTPLGSWLDCIKFLPKGQFPTCFSTLS